MDVAAFLGGGPESDLSVVDGVSASGRDGVDPQGVAADGAGGTTAGEGGADWGAPPKLKDEGDPPKLNGDAGAAGLGVDDAAPKTGIAADGFGDENGFAGTEANGLDAAGVADEPPNEKGEEEGAPAPNAGAAEGAPPPKLNPPPNAGLGADEG